MLFAYRSFVSRAYACLHGFLPDFTVGRVDKAKMVSSGIALLFL